MEAPKAGVMEREVVQLRYDMENNTMQIEDRSAGHRQPWKGGGEPGRVK